MEKLKKCTQCKEEKNLVEYSYHNTSEDNLYNKCKQCIHNNHYTEIPPNPIGKNCTVCNEFKFAESYRFKKTGKWKLTAQCNDCVSEKNKIKASKVKPTPYIDIKTCSKCNLPKTLDNYIKDSYKSDGLRPECNHCKAEGRALRRDRELEMGKIYCANNRPRQREYANKRHKYRRETDPLYKMTSSIRGRVKAGFSKTSKGQIFKSKTTEAILGCTFLEFKLHIESQLESWMNWDNYGNCDGASSKCSWHLDHILPLKLATTEEGLYLLNHWSNFQPLCSKINMYDKKDRVYPCTNLELGITFWEDRYEYVSKPL